MMRAFMPGDPLSPERIAARRVAVLDFISAAVFTKDPAKGAGVATTEGSRGRKGKEVRR